MEITYLDKTSMESDTDVNQSATVSLRVAFFFFLKEKSIWLIDFGIGFIFNSSLNTNLKFKQ